MFLFWHDGDLVGFGCLVFSIIAFGLCFTWLIFGWVWVLVCVCWLWCLVIVLLGFWVSWLVVATCYLGLGGFCWCAVWFDFGFCVFAFGFYDFWCELVAWRMSSFWFCCLIVCAFVVDLDSCAFLFGFGLVDFGWFVFVTILLPVCLFWSLGFYR